ncbi:MAG TPA: histidine kinase [Streptosporangiaceae bacterium]|nr:histidine kinase [Streptosporangiaceae bacterium]
MGETAGLRAGLGTAPWRKIGAVFALSPPARLSRSAGWIGLAAFAVPLLTGLVTQVSPHPARVAAGAVVALTFAVPLFLTRTRLTLPLAAAATVGVALIGTGDSRDVAWISVVVLTVWCPLAGGIVAGVVYWAASLALFGGEYLWVKSDPGWAPWTAGITVSLFAAGLIQRQMTLVEQLRAAQAGLAERSRAEERNRIARELHDVIAHSLTVSLLHVTSARLAVEHDPDDAARSLAEAERLGRQSLAEVRATMGLLRPAATPDGIAPPVPGLDQVSRLVTQLRDTGADIDLSIDGETAGLPATTGSAVYRIVQEALTNATRHAPGQPVTVRVAVTGGHVDVAVDSAGPPGQPARHGLGLISMRERAEMHGGTCTAGPGGAGWLVHATLPSPAAATA